MHLILFCFFVLVSTREEAWNPFKKKGKKVRSYNDTTLCYTFRRQFNVTNFRNNTVNEVLLKINTQEFAENIVHEDCMDLQFKTVPFEDAWASKLNHWFESSCPSAETYVWVEITIEPEETETFYMYYYCDEVEEQTELPWSGDGHFITMSVGSTCGTGWESYDDMEGYFPKAGVDENLDEVFGTKVGIEGEASHGHSVSGSELGHMPSKFYIVDAIKSVAGVTVSDYQHKHAVDSEFYSEMLPPYAQVLYCQSNKYYASTDQLFLFTNTTKLVDLVELSIMEFVSEIDGKFLMCGSEVNTEPLGVATHDHFNYSALSTLPTVDRSYKAATQQGYPVLDQQHAHRHTITSTSSSLHPEYLTVPIGKLVSAVNPLGPSNLVLATVIPPLGWVRVKDLDHKFVLAESRSDGKYMTEGGSATHDHVYDVVNILGADLSVYMEGFELVFDYPTSVFFNNFVFPNHTHPDNVGISGSTANNEIPTYYVRYYRRKDQSDVEYVMSEEQQMKEIALEGEIPWIVFIPIFAGAGAIIFCCVVLVIVICIVSFIVYRTSHSKKQKQFEEKLKEDAVVSAEKEVELLEEKEKLAEEKAKLDEEMHTQEKEASKYREAYLALQEKHTEIQSKSLGESTLVKITHNAVEIDKEIGKGRIGFVIYRAKFKHHQVLFRVFREDVFKTKRFNIFEFFEAELKEYSCLSHENILQYQAYTKPPKVGVVTEYCEKGHLKGFLSRKKDINFDQKMKILQQISGGMSYLHSKGIVHRDLRMENIFLTKDFQVKIDFGFNRTFNKNYAQSRYAAPELIDQRDPPEDDTEFPDNEKFVVKCDVFSFAIITFELITGNFKPYGGKSSNNIGEMVSKDPEFRPDIDSIAERLPNYVVNLCKTCWDDDAAMRPSFEQINQIITNVIDE